MKIVIDIPEEDFDFIKDQFADGDMPDEKDLKETTYYAIANGTVLPKGHGRLVDADAITKHIEIFKQSFVINYDQLTGTSSIACTVPSVIEANKEVDG